MRIDPMSEFLIGKSACLLCNPRINSGPLQKTEKLGSASTKSLFMDSKEQRLRG